MGLYPNTIKSLDLDLGLAREQFGYHKEGKRDYILYNNIQYFMENILLIDYICGPTLWGPSLMTVAPFILLTSHDLASGIFLHSSNIPFTVELNLKKKKKTMVITLFKVKAIKPWARLIFLLNPIYNANSFHSSFLV